MSSRQRTVPPFAVELRPSRIWLALLSGSVLVLAVASLCYLPLRTAACLLLPLPGVLWYGLRHDGWWPSRQRIGRIEVSPEGQLAVWFGPFSVEASVDDDSVITPWLVVLNLSLEERRRSLVLWPDSAERESLRALRVYLRWFHAREPASAPI
ncbi:protein YgfX [Pseudogulbenkiania sp. MAI-1]|uniref:protein YgfX n=1 Tax=Pseudogulbenkiania sp. MAI-1 TaxID=990370 RepID=UPI00045E7D58|nr:protein YgfX [Pseudogulbenkiania sp. MAI-1]